MEAVWCVLWTSLSRTMNILQGSSPRQHNLYISQTLVSLKNQVQNLQIAYQVIFYIHNCFLQGKWSYFSSKRLKLNQRSRLGLSSSGLCDINMWTLWRFFLNRHFLSHHVPATCSLVSSSPNTFSHPSSFLIIRHSSLFNSFLDFKTLHTLITIYSRKHTHYMLCRIHAWKITCSFCLSAVPGRLKKTSKVTS